MNLQLGDALVAVFRMLKLSFDSHFLFSSFEARTLKLSFSKALTKALWLSSCYEVN